MQQAMKSQIRFQAYREAFLYREEIWGAKFASVVRAMISRFDESGGTAPV